MVERTCRRDCRHRKDQRFRSRLRRAQHDRSHPHRRHSRAVHEARDARRQRRPIAVDGAHRPDDRLRSSQRPSCGNSITGLRQAPTATSGSHGTTRTARECRCRRLSPHARLKRSTPRRHRSIAPVAFEARPSEPGKSRYRIRLPGAHLPIVALELNIGGGHVLRRATVNRVAPHERQARSHRRRQRHPSKSRRRCCSPPPLCACPSPRLASRTSIW